MSKNYNSLHVPSGGQISGTDTESITVGDIRDAIWNLPDDTEVTFGVDENGNARRFYRFKSRGPKNLAFEFND